MEENKPQIGKIALGFSIIVLSVIFIFGNPQVKPEKILGYSFKDEPVEVVGFEPQESEEVKVPTRILIPDLSIDLSVKKAEIIEGYWEVFEDSAAWGDGSGLPGEVGNQVIFAHARKGLFLPLREVEEGMKVYTFTDSDWYTYEVTEIKEVLPNETEVIAETEDERITLYTCSGFNDSKRIIVIGKRI